MFHLVAYDIASPKRLKKIASLCLDYGVRIQYSVFQFDLNEELTACFLDRLQEIIDPAQDSVMVIPVCGTCRKKIHVFGQGKLYEEPLLFQL